MSFVNELRKQGAEFSLVVGAGSFILGIILAFLGSAWGWVFGAVGFLLIGAGIKSYAASSAVEGIPKLLAMISRHTEPEWDGEILYTDGGRHQICYIFDSRRRLYFIASDVCNAIGTKSPRKDTLHWGGAPLLVQSEHLCFSREAVEAYLTPLGVKNHEANRLLTILRNEVFRKIDRASY